MSTIECYECKGKVSSQANACPHCGLPIEVEIQYHVNGQMKILLFLKDGKADGLDTWWYESGQKQYEANHKDGERHGLYTEWYENWQKKSEGNYKDGKLDGLWIYYNKDGTEDCRLTCEDGEIVID